MGYVHLSRHVDAGPERVFSMVVDVDVLPTWLSLIDEVRAASPRLDVEGAQLCALMALGPRHLEVDWTVAKVEANRLLHLEGTAVEGGEATVNIECGLWDGGTEFEFDMEYQLPGGFVTSLADHLYIGRAIAHDLKRSLKSLAAMAADQPS